VAIIIMMPVILGSPSHGRQNQISADSTGTHQAALRLEIGYSIISFRDRASDSDDSEARIT
jgi:hypothetical protein